MEREVNYPQELRNNPLKVIFALQRDLISHYIKIEGLPPYPINVSEKSHQKLMREFIRRGIEEVSEAHDTYQELFKLVDSNNKDKVKSLNLVLDFNEELSDALHFFIEALLYSNISWEDIDMYYMELYRASNWEGAEKVSPLQKCIEYARFLLSSQGYELNNDGFETITEESGRFFNCCAGRFVSLKSCYRQAELMWDVVHNFMKATNLLKNNDWKQTETETDAEQFQRQMMQGWIALMNLLVYSGLNNEGIYLMYCHKNKINQDRIKNKR